MRPSSRPTRLGRGRHRGLVTTHTTLRNTFPAGVVVVDVVDVADSPVDSGPGGPVHRACRSGNVYDFSARSLPVGRSYYRAMLTVGRRRRYHVTDGRRRRVSGQPSTTDRCPAWFDELRQHYVASARPGRPAGDNALMSKSP